MEAYGFTPIFAAGQIIRLSCQEVQIQHLSKGFHEVLPMGKFIYACIVNFILTARGWVSMLSKDHCVTANFQSKHYNCS